MGRDTLSELQIDEYKGRFYISYPDGEKFEAQTYKTAAAAKRALTYYRKSV